jgi:transcriptional regulator with XRE-family HTH domain
VSLNDTFARNFEAACEASPLLHTQIADKSGYSPNYLRKLRRGHCPRICLHTVEVLAQTLDLPVAALLEQG